MAYNGIGTALLAYLQKHEKRIVTIDEMVKEFKGQYDRTQIVSNMGNLCKKPAGAEIEKLQTGAWRYMGNISRDKQPDATRVFEMIRELPDSLLLIGDDDRLYRARPIE